MIAWGLAAAAGAAAICARWNWWRVRVSGLAAPMYHQIGEAPAAARLKKLWVRPEDFRSQMRYLRSNGFTPVLPKEIAELSAKKKPWPDKPVLVTFDDGYADNYEAAFPILKEFGIKAAVFLVCDAIGGHNAFNRPEDGPWRRMLTWERIFEMRDSGLVEFGSHTMTHPVLSRIPREQARWEIEESKRFLEAKLGAETLAFAYPYGDGAYDEDVRAMVLRAGYRLDFGIKQGISPVPWNPDRGPLKRLLVRGDDWALDFHLNMTRGRARL